MHFNFNANHYGKEADPRTRFTFIHVYCIYNTKKRKKHRILKYGAQGDHKRAKMLALPQTPFPSLTYLSFQLNGKRRKQQNHRKQNRTSHVMYALYNIYTVITTSTIIADQYFR